jgi:hypothetical protein
MRGRLSERSTGKSWMTIAGGVLEWRRQVAETQLPGSHNTEGDRQGGNVRDDVTNDEW